MPQFREIAIHDLHQESIADGGVTGRNLLHSQTVVEVPPVSFGCDAASLAARGKADAVKVWGASQFRPAQVVLWSIEGAEVHGPYGVITLGKWVIRESLLHVPFGTPGYHRAEGLVDLPDSTARHRTPQAWHVASGAIGNYYHWSIDILPKLQIHPFCERVFEGSLIMPPATLPFQIGSAAILERHGYPVLPLEPGEAAAVGRLMFIANMTGAGFAPHPCLGRFFDRMIAVSGAPSLPPRRLYVTRANTLRRPLRNEAAVIDMLRPLGFDVVDPGALSLQDQIAIFASATHVVAPHGAGVTNIIYCRPGTQICELHMDAYINLSYRRFAALRDLRYGAVVGDAEIRDVPWRHALSWTVDPARVRSAVGNMGI